MMIKPSGRRTFYAEKPWWDYQRAFSEGKIMGHCHLYEYINGKSSFVDGVILQAYKKEIQNHL
jgi:hypothetical protein